MVEICQRTKSKAEMIEQSLEQYKELFIKTRRDFEKIVTVSFFHL